MQHSIIDALEDPAQLRDRADSCNPPESDRHPPAQSGSLRVDSQIHWARNYFVWAGLLDGSERDAWALTPTGWKLDLGVQDHAAAHQLFKKVCEDKKYQWGQSEGDGEDDPSEQEESEALDEEEYEEIALAVPLRTTLQGLRPAGFENLCQRLLTQLGLVQLRTVGQAGDRGIDVEGHLRVNAVSFRVGAQCKLYADGNKIVPPQIREFQGALGPFDRGIFATTSVFTQQARSRRHHRASNPLISSTANVSSSCFASITRASSK